VLDTNCNKNHDQFNHSEGVQRNNHEVASLLMFGAVVNFEDVIPSEVKRSRGTPLASDTLHARINLPRPKLAPAFSGSFPES
jgi:hypothetical protein